MPKQTPVTSTAPAPSAPQSPAAAATTAGKSIEDSLQTLIDDGTEAIDTFKTRVSDITDEAKTRGSRFADRATDLITERPFTGVALAFGVGYVAMRITTSKLVRVAALGGLLYLAGGLLRK